MLPAFLSPKGISRNLYIPKGVMMAVFWMSSGATGTWYYPFWRSSLENTVEPLILKVKLVMFGRG